MEDKKETKEERKKRKGIFFLYLKKYIYVRVLIKLSRASVKCLYSNWDREMKNILKGNLSDRLVVI